MNREGDHSYISVYIVLINVLANQISKLRTRPKTTKNCEKHRK